MDMLAPYSHALASLAMFSLLMVILAGLSTRGRTSENRCACGQVKRDYSDPAYRRGRAHANAMEIAGPFIAATLAAMLTGASPFWVNTLASVFLVARIAMAVVHIRTEIQVLRSVFWAIGTICVVVLGLMGLRGAF